MIARRTLLLGAAAAPALAQAQAGWDAVLAAARGATVNWNAWAGDERTNAFIAWAGEMCRARHGITVRHVRLRDTAEAVSRVVAEKAAGRTEGGSVDLIWINGPNFLSMKEQGLHFGPFVERLPNWRSVDTVNKPSNVVDFTVPVDGLAAPWRMARIVFVHDTARLADPPRSAAAMLAWSRANPGRLTHPNVRNFLGATFLKQALIELVPDRAVLARPVDDAGYAATVAPLWAWYEALRPTLWRQGRTFPENGPAQRNLLTDGEIDLFISFNPAEAAVGIANGLLPPTARAYVPDGGSIGNTSFVSIPFNASAKEAAMVVADFLLSPEAQARGQDPRHLGNPTVLDLGKLGPEDRARFDALRAVPGLVPPEALGTPLPEPHPSWMTRIAADWERRVSG